MKKLNLQAVNTPVLEPRWLTILEIFIVLCIALFPALQKSVLAFLYPEKFGQQPFLWFSLNGMVGLLWTTIPVLYIMWRSPYSWEQFGMHKFRFPRDFGAGLLYVIGMWVFVFAVIIAVTFVVVLFLLPLGKSLPMQSPQNAPIMDLIHGPSGCLEYVLMVFFTLGVGFFEELVMRGYVMTKMQALKNNVWFCVLGSSLIFGIGHIYQGGYAVLGTTLIGVGFGTIFWFRRRIWPLAIAHAIHDMVALSAISYIQHVG